MQELENASNTNYQSLNMSKNNVTENLSFLYQAAGQNDSISLKEATEKNDARNSKKAAKQGTKKNKKISTPQENMTQMSDNSKLAMTKLKKKNTKKKTKKKSKKISNEKSTTKDYKKSALKEDKKGKKILKLTQENILIWCCINFLFGYFDSQSDNSKSVLHYLTPIAQNDG